MPTRMTIDEAVSRGLLSKAQAAKMNVPRQRKSDAEGEEQAQFIDLFRERFPSHADSLIHIPNGGSRANRFEGWRLKRQGARAGVSDLLLAVPTARYHGLWIEFKAARPNDARVSAAQRDWIAIMLRRGYQALVCRGVAEALAAATHYLEDGAAPE